MRFSQATINTTLDYRTLTKTIYYYLQHNFIINYDDFNQLFKFFYGVDYIKDSNMLALQDIKIKALEELQKNRSSLFQISTPYLVIDANTAETNIKDKIAFIESFRKLDSILRSTLIRLINEGYVDRNLRIVIDRINKYMSDVRKLAPISIDFSTDWGKTIWFIGSWGPWLIEHNWLTKQSDGTFSVTYDGKGLDHAEVDIYDPMPNKVNHFIIRDVTLLEAIIALQPLLQVPDNQISQLEELTGHVSGADWHNRAVNIAVTVIVVAIAIYAASAAAAYLTSTVLGPTGASVAKIGLATNELYKTATGRQGIASIQGEMTKPFMQNLMKQTLLASSNSGVILPNGTTEQYKIIAGAIMLDPTLSPEAKTKALNLLNNKTGGAITSSSTSSSDTPKDTLKSNTNTKTLVVTGIIGIGGIITLIALNKFK